MLARNLVGVLLLSVIVGEEVCYNVQIETLSDAKLGCVNTTGTSFEYYLIGSLRGDLIGNTVLFENKCYQPGSICEVDYCVDIEAKDQDEFQLKVNQTRLRRNHGKSGKADMWIFEMTVNGERIAPTETCADQIALVERLGCSCDTELIGISSENTLPKFEPGNLIQGTDDSDNSVIGFVEENVLAVAAVFIASMVLCGFVTLRRQAPRKRTLTNVVPSSVLTEDQETPLGSTSSGVYLSNTDLNKKKKKRRRGRIAKYKFLSSELTLSGKKPPKVSKRQLSEEDVKSVEEFRQLVISNKMERNSDRSFERELCASITFKEEQRMRKLKDVMIERMILLSIESLDVQGPGATPRNTPFRKLSKNSEDFRRMPFGQFLENLRKGVNEFVEEDDEEGDSLGNKCLIIALVYLRRAKAKNTSLFLNDSNVRNLFFISIIVATKFMDDFMIPNSFWAEFAEIDVKDLNEMELSFCDYMDYDLFITAKDVKKVIDELDMSFSAKF